MHPHGRAPGHGAAWCAACMRCCLTMPSSSGATFSLDFLMDHHSHTPARQHSRQAGLARGPRSMPCRRACCVVDRVNERSLTLPASQCGELHGGALQPLCANPCARWALMCAACSNAHPPPPISSRPTSTKAAIMAYLKVGEFVMLLWSTMRCPARCMLLPGAALPVLEAKWWCAHCARSAGGGGAQRAALRPAARQHCILTTSVALHCHPAALLLLLEQQPPRPHPAAALCQGRPSAVARATIAALHCAQQQQQQQVAGIVAVRFPDSHLSPMSHSKFAQSLGMGIRFVHLTSSRAPNAAALSPACAGGSSGRTDAHHRAHMTSA